LANTLAWRTDGRLFVSVHTAQNPSKLEWSGFVKTAREIGLRGNVRVYAVSYGGGPDGAQRSELTTALEGRPSPTVLLTSSRLVRALAGVLHWFNREMCAVGLHDHAAACSFLALSPEEGARAAELRHEIEAELGIAASDHPQTAETR
jgi:hypothetical protein